MTAGWFQTTASPSNGPIVNGPASYSADGLLVPPQLCVGTSPCPTANYIGSGWSQWESISSGGECGLAFKMLPTANTDQVQHRQSFKLPCIRVVPCTPHHPGHTFL